MQTSPQSLGPKAAGQEWRVARLTGIVALLLSLCLGTGGAWAVSGADDPPVYNPASKSYFQLLKGTGSHNRWTDALEQARAQVYRGVPGRLAVIDRAETHEFVMENFDVSREIWVGLRYWCEFRMLEWVGLRPYSPTDPDRFQFWHTPWSRGDQGCLPGSRGSQAFMGVYYQPLGKRNARWQAVRKGKGFGQLLVEFPTGAE